MKTHPHSSSSSIVVHPEIIDHANNPSPRVPLAILCDTSFSMHGAPLAALQHGLKTLFSEIQQDMLAQLRCDPSIWGFGGRVSQLMPWESTFVGATPVPELNAAGSTPLGAAVFTAIQAINDRRDTYRANAIPSYAPWVVIFSDGVATDEWREAAAKLSMLAKNSRWNVVCLGTGPDVDLECLAKFSPDRPPLHIRDASSCHSFAEFFRWLSASIKITSRRSTSCQTTMAPLPDCIDIVE